MGCGVIATFTNKEKLNPYWVTGFVDGDASFTTILSREFQRITLSFEISLHSKDVAILYRIKDFFGCGNVTTRSNINRSTYRVTSLKDITEKIIPHFENYSLYTQKQLDFIVWAKLASMLNINTDRSTNYIESLIPYVAALNKGLSDTQKIRFPNIKAVDKGDYILPEIINPFWMSGFVAAEGSFYLLLRNSGQFVNTFSITQDHRDLQLFEKFSEFFNCGKNYHRPNSSRCDFVVQTRPHIIEIIIPFFNKYPLVNIKTLDFEDFSKALSLHGQPGWRETVEVIIKGMNSKRIFPEDQE